MSVRPVSSRQNSRVRLVRRLARDASARRDAGTCLVEGPRVAREHLLAGGDVTLALVSPRLDSLDSSDVRALLNERATATEAEILEVTDDVLASCLDARSPQGVVLVVPRPAEVGLEDVRGELPILVTWELQDPSNVGAIARTAAGAGCDALVVARGPRGPAADPFSPRSVRASAGSVLRLPLVQWSGEPAELAAELAALRCPTVACVPTGGVAPEAAPLAGRAAILVGSETRGLPPELVGEHAVTVPLARGVESLGAAAAASVIAFEAARQRRLKG